MDITTLVAKLEAARTAYYNQAPLMDDATYDALEDQLRALDPGNAFLAKVGAAAPIGGAWPKVKHAIPMGSLNKAQTIAELKSWYVSCGDRDTLVVMDKLDGASIALRYENRRLVQALTRGDGTTGEDITRNVLLMKGAVKALPPTLPDGTPMPKHVYVRGEVVCLHTDFNAHFKGESNPRNTASGTMKRQSDASKCAYLTVIAYQFLPAGVALESKQQELLTLKSMGFNVPRFEMCQGLTDVEKLYQEYSQTIRKSLDYDVDGLVVDINDRSVRDSLGELNNRPKGSVALKFPHEKQPTKLLDIEWQVGNSGRVTPVAVFEPVTLAGAQIQRASLAGIRQVEHLKLYKGCNILVARRNDCIPRVEANLDLGIENDL